MRFEPAGDAKVLTRSRSVLALGSLELVGGAFFAVGLLTPFAAYAIATVSITTLRSYVLRARPTRVDSTFDLQFTVLAVVLAVTATGPLRGSLDEVLGNIDDRLSGLLWAAGVFAAALVTSLVISHDAPIGT